jgi:uridylate kinase
VVLMGKSGVDGVYDADPRTTPAATKYDRLTHSMVLAQDLKVADGTAISLCRDNGLPLIVFDLIAPGNIRRAAAGLQVGTLVA